MRSRRHRHGPPTGVAGGAAIALLCMLFVKPAEAQEARTLDLVRGDYAVLEEVRWSALDVGAPSQLRLVDQGTDLALSLRVNMKKDKGSARVLGAAIENVDKGSLFLEWSAAQTRVIITIGTKNLGYVLTRKAGSSFIVERKPLDKLICGGSSSAGASQGIPLDPAQAFRAPAVQSAAPVAAAAAAPIYNSNPGATSVVLLDFDGHTVSGTFWNSGYNNGNDIVASPFDWDGDAANFSEYERAIMKYAFDEVADDFAPFTINVTTSEEVFEAANPFSRIRVLITPTNYFFPGYGGVAFYDSFRWGDDTPVWTWNHTFGSMGETCSHEVGHSVGLYHDGGPLGFAAPTYYGGYDTGDNLYWSPIMGAYFGEGVKHWSRGEYPEANNTQDDLLTMTSGFGFSFRSDDVGDNTATAAEMPIIGRRQEQTGTWDVVQQGGVIAQGQDVDVFAFTPRGTGVATLRVFAAKSPTSHYYYENIGNLNIQAQLLNAAGAVIATADEPGSLDATLSASVEAGKRYYLTVTGVGKPHPQGFGIPDYHSLGQYMISGTLPTTQGQTIEPVVARRGNITVDGQVDAAWEGVAQRPLKLIGGARGADEATATWRAVWDESNLYLLAEVPDKRIFSDSLHAWEDDAVEIFLDIGGKRQTAYGPTDYQYVVRALGQAVALGVNSAPAVPGISVKSVATFDGYRTEIAIPWNKTGGFVPAEGASIGIDVHVSDDDDGAARDGKFTWWGAQDNAWQNPSAFAPAKLVRAADVLVELAPAAPTIDGQTELVWDSVPRNALDRVIRGSAPTDRSFYRVMSDATALYLLVDVTDEAHIADSKDPWEDDAVELFLDLRGNRGSTYDADDVQMVFRWNDPYFYLGLRSAPVSGNGVNFKMVKTGRGYRLEAAIAWSALPAQPGIGSVIGLDVQVDDDDNGGGREAKVAWAAGTDEAWQNPGLFGVAVRASTAVAATAVAPRSGTAPTLDGSLSEWSRTQWRPIDQVLMGATGGPADSRSEWQARATDEALFVAVRVEDDVLKRDSQHAWQDDSIEIYFDGNASRGGAYDGVNDAQWVVRVYDNTIHAGVNSIGSTGVIMTQVHQTVGGSQVTTMEMKVPWHVLKVTPGAGHTFGIDVHINDDDDGGDRDNKQAWFGTSDNAWARPDAFAQAVLKP